MGSGIYSVSNRVVRANVMGYHTKDINAIFESKNINNAMSPNGVAVRESRDSEEHPNSLAIILALDVTGSMGSIPHHLVKKGLPNIMDSILKSDIKDPQILFLGIGDHECDKAPLQVGQFESSDDLLDKWLTTIYLEGGGGGNDGESYLLAWYFAGRHTSIDCFEKRKQKGFLFTIGDEPALKTIPRSNLRQIMGKGEFSDGIANVLLDEARKTYHVFHVHVKEGMNGRRQEVMDGWKQLMGDNLIIAEKHQDISNIISSVIKSNIVSTANSETGVIKNKTEKEDVIL